MGTRRTNLLVRLVTLVALGATLAACSGDGGGSTGDRLVVVTSTSIPGVLATEVGGDLVEVETLIPPGTDPHTFDVTPGDVRTIAEADVVLLIGLGLDDFLHDVIESGNDSVRVAIVTDGVQLLEDGDDHEDEDEHDETTEHDAEEDDHDHGEFDPHVWQDPLRVKVMVENIADALAAADPDNASTYQDNAVEYQATLDDTHEQIEALVAEIPAERRKLVTNHDAFAYFADRYSLDVVGTVIPGTSSDADPSAGSIAELTELIRDEGVAAIFAEALIDPAVAESLASDTGVEIVYGLYTDQVGEPGSGAETVHEMLLANATRISEALR